MYTYVYIRIYSHMDTHIDMCVWIEREREREICNRTYSNA